MTAERERGSSELTSETLEALARIEERLGTLERGLGDERAPDALVRRQASARQFDFLDPKKVTPLRLVP